MRSKTIIAVACIVCFFTGIAGAIDVRMPEVDLLLAGKDQASLDRAVAVLQRIAAEEGENAEILCLLAEAHFYYGDWFSGTEQIQIWEQGEQYARRALELDPRSADAHYWVAAMLGKIGRARGILRSLLLVNPMLEHLETALEIDKEHSWAHYVLSHLYSELPPKPLGRGDRSQALFYARSAFELEPEEPEFVLQYAKLLLKEKQEEEALSLLREALQASSVRWTASLYSEAEGLARRLDRTN